MHGTQLFISVRFQDRLGSEVRSYGYRHTGQILTVSTVLEASGDEIADVFENAVTFLADGSLWALAARPVHKRCIADISKAVFETGLA